MPQNTSRSNRTMTLDPRSANDFELVLGRADMVLSKSYLTAVGTASVVPADATQFSLEKVEALNETIRFFEIGQIVLDSSENPRDKLVSVFNAVGSSGAGLLLLVKGMKDRISIKLGIKSFNSDNTMKSAAILQNCLVGNFPGSKILPVRSEALRTAWRETFGNKNCAIVSVTDVAGVRSEQESRERRFIQGIEKVVDAMRGREYSILLIADPVGNADLAASRRALEDIYTGLVPFSETQLTVGANESAAISKSIAKTVSDSVSKSVSDTVSRTTGHTTTETVGENVGGGIPFVANVGFSLSEGESTSISDTNGKTIGQVDAHTIGETGTDGKTITSGSSRSMQVKFENHAIKGLLKKIDKTLERYDTCADVGMWNSAVYVIAGKQEDAEMAASAYHATVRGKNSSLETGRIATWTGDAREVALEHLKRFNHPVVSVAGMSVTPGTLVSSAELAISAGLPNSSLPGLPVLECAKFGRTVASYDAAEETAGETYSVSLGKIWNMNHEEDLPVRLNPDSLTSHTFVTGSTGSGKSNTIYRILSEISSKAASFLVIEPAKGEYKDVLGHDSSVKVYGTNPKLEKLLRINPFSFPEGVHILEHLDRLVEIFNVCWPMYAAMPAVLKDAIEKAYVECGWNLVESANPYGKNLFPTFSDVARCVKNVIDSSEYDAENKGAYKGSLLTRLASLTNGLNALVFSPDELPAKELFDCNAIADLSRIGSSETKALIMGVLVLKLQEHRMEQRMTDGQMNASLRHVTVLEEAHNLLRRGGGAAASGESGGAALQAKSVEMLANAIAEMRTYGEGFIIADQSPGLLDMSVIRNTNTKIVMRLPDLGDRELVGRAMHLDEAQIAELARLPRGVAAVCQNEWIESVLCKVQKHEIASTPPSTSRAKESVGARAAQKEMPVSTGIAIASLVINGTPLPPDVAKDFEEGRIPLSARSRVIVSKVQKGEIVPPKFTQTSSVVSELFPQCKQSLQAIVERTGDKSLWTTEMYWSLPEMGQDLKRDVMQSIATETLLMEMNRKADFNAWYGGGYLK